MGLRTKILVAAVAVVMLVPVLAVGMGDNPLKNAKVGEWIEYVTRSGAMGQTMEMKMKQTVIAKDATSVTLRSETTMMGKKMPPQDSKIELNKPYEPYKQGMPAGMTVTPLGSGSETITVGGKAYACTWTKVKIVMTSPQAMTGTTKVWVCPDVPVTSVVKMESETAMNAGGQDIKSTMTMELVGSGK